MSVGKVHTETKLELKKRAIMACQDKTGRVTPAAVIAAARDPKSPLHDEFEWDVDKAALQAWTETARRLIREVRLVVQYEDIKVVAPFYVADNRTDAAGYIETTRVANKHAAAKQSLADEVARIKGAIARARTLAMVFGLTSNFERMLDLAVEIERTIDTASEATTVPALPS